MQQVNEQERSASEKDAIDMAVAEIRAFNERRASTAGPEPVTSPEPLSRDALVKLLSAAGLLLSEVTTVRGGAYRLQLLQLIDLAVQAERSMTPARLVLLRGEDVFRAVRCGERAGLVLRNGTTVLVDAAAARTALATLGGK